MTIIISFLIGAVCTSVVAWILSKDWKSKNDFLKKECKSFHKINKALVKKVWTAEKSVEALKIMLKVRESMIEDLKKEIMITRHPVVIKKGKYENK